MLALPFAFSGCLDSGNGVDSLAQMEEDIKVIDSYLSTNGIDAIKDKSGVRYVIKKLGVGLPPKTDQSIKVVYKGYFLSGTVFDEGGNATSLLSSLITGWQLALSVWPKGTQGTLYVPSPLGYGSQQVGTIPPNTILVFDIEIVDILPTVAEKARLASDIAAIDQYLSDRSINAVKDSTGVRYVITNAGTGPLPTWYTKVRFNYTGKLLTSGNQFFSGTSQPTDTFDSRMVDFIHGIKVGLSKIGAGGKVTIYVPSGLAFGPYENSSSPVPANSNVIYDIELQELY